MSNFQKVKTFNRAFDMVSKEPKEYLGYEEDKNGHIKINPIKYFRPKFFESPSLIRLRLNLIKEEIEELNDAIKVNDIKETRDAIGDILYVVYGMADVMGIDIDYIFTHSIQNEIVKYNIDNCIDDINKVFIDKIIKATKATEETEKKTEKETEMKVITNFNYVKIFYNELLDNDKNSNQSNEDLNKYMLDKINTLYIKLEKECESQTIYFEALKQYEYNINKCLIISKLIYDLLKWTYIIANKYKFNADSDFSIIHESNMSKLCDTEEDAKLTVIDYENKYKAGKSPYDSPYYYELPELGKWIVKNKSSGKALKNIKYKEVSFE
jgi:predicted HAD superfamily Cof-like phosphohydrolase